MEEQLDINELIKLEQLPKIFYQLEAIGSEIDKQLAGIENLECTEETKQDVKRRRTEINNLNAIMEDKRKTIKKKILEDYEVFNEKYEEEIKSKLTYASAVLKEKIDEIENVQKQGKENNLREFFSQYCTKYHLEGIISYEQLNINVALSASEKSLKEAIKSQLERVANDIALINLEEYASEILDEYKNNYDFAKSKLAVVERHHRIEELERQRQEAESKKQVEQEITEKVEEIIAPVEIVEEVQEELITVSFTITGTKEQIVKVREFMKKEGIKYE